VEVAVLVPGYASAPTPSGGGCGLDGGGSAEGGAGTGAGDAGDAAGTGQNQP
jgi:hypothetical protein